MKEILKGIGPVRFKSFPSVLQILSSVKVFITPEVPFNTETGEMIIPELKQTIINRLASGSSGSKKISQQSAL